MHPQSQDVFRSRKLQCTKEKEDADRDVQEDDRIRFQKKVELKRRGKKLENKNY